MEADKTKEQLINELTELRQENSELEEKYRFLYESHPAINMIIGTDGVIKDINDTLIRKYGFTRDEIIGKHILKFVISNQRKKVAAQLRRDFKGEFTSEIEVDIYAKDRSIHTILFSAGNAILKEKGQLAGILITGIDITERKKIEKKLIHLSNALQVSSDSIVISDLEGKITDVNEVTLKMYGTDNKADLIGKSTFDIIAPEDREKAIAGTKEVMEKGYIKDREYHIVIKDGSKIPVEMSTSIMKGSDGEPIGFVAVSRDITERLSAEQAGKRVGETLRRTEDIYRRAIASADAVPYQLHYVSNSYEYMGEGIVQLTGYTAEEMNPTLWRKMIKQSILYGDAEELEWDEAVRQTRAGKFKRWRSDNLIATRDGQERWIADASVEIRNAEGVSIGSVGILMDITDWKHAQEMLQKSERKYRLISERTSDSIAISTFGLKPIYLYVSPSVKTLLGYEPEELIGESVFKFVHPDDKKKMLPLLKRYLSEKAKIFLTGKDSELSETIEYRIIAKSGNWHYFQSTVNFIGNDLLFISRDITDKKQVEERLRNSEKMYRTMIENSNDMIWMLDKKGNFDYSNKRAEELTGYNLKDWLGKGFAPMIPADDLPRIQRIFTETVKGKSQHYDVDVIKSNGSIITLSVNATPLFQSGEIIGAVNFGRDITDRQQYIQKIEQASTEWRETFDAITDIVMLISPKYEIMRVNRTGYESLGKEPEEIIGRKCYEVVHGLDAPIEGCPCQETIRTKKAAVGEFSQDGRFYFATAAPVLGKNNEISAFAHTVHDISNRKQTEEELKQKTDKIISGQKEIENLYEKSEKARKSLLSILADVTEKEKALRESEGRFRDVVNNTGDWIWEIDKEGRYTYSSPVIKQILSYEDKEVLGKHFYDFFHPDERDELKKDAFEVFNQKKSLKDFINRNVHKDGHVVILETSGVPLLDDSGNLLGYRGVDRDVTERKRAEEELQKRLRELEIYYKATIGRESRIIELKQQVNELLVQIGKAKKYDV